MKKRLTICVLVTFVGTNLLFFFIWRPLHESLLDDKQIYKSRRKGSSNSVAMKLTKDFHNFHETMIYSTPSNPEYNVYPVVSYSKSKSKSSAKEDAYNTNLKFSYHHSKTNKSEEFTNFSYELKLNSRNYCGGRDVSLLIGVCSSPDKFDYRNAIRQTWGYHSKKRGVKVIFVLGLSQDRFVQQHIERESLKHGDIVQYDFVDSYFNLTIKTIGLLKWSLDHCNHVKFLVKTDTDVFLNVPLLMRTVVEASMNNQKSFMQGYVIKGATPMKDRNSKWFVPKSSYRDKTYPPYLSGSAYIISSDLIQPLYTSAKMYKTQFWLEDIYITGILAKDVGATLLHDKRFWYRKTAFSPCSYLGAISAHELSADELITIWTGIQQKGLDCTRQEMQY